MSAAHASGRRAVRRAGCIALVVCACLLSGGLPAAQAQTFTDDPIVAGVTPVRAVHILELRQTIDQLRAIAGLPPSAWTDPALTPGVTAMRAVHVTELRARLDEALTRLGYGTSPYTDPSLSPASSIVRAVHLTELRARVQAAIAQVGSGPPIAGGGSGSSGSGGSGGSSGGTTGGGTTSVLIAGQYLSSLTSADGRFQFVYQGDGNIVLYQGTTALWSSQTYGSSVGAAVMQSDGNFVLYDASGTAIWDTHTYGHPGA